MSDSDRMHYRDNTQDYFSISDRDSELAPSEASEVIASPRRRADASQEDILGGNGPENLFFNELRLDNAKTRPPVLQADLARRLALENARRRLEIPDKRALDEANERAFDEAFMADNNGGAIGGPQGTSQRTPPGLNLGNQVDPQVGPLQPPRVPPVGNPAQPLGAQGYGNKTFQPKLRASPACTRTTT